MTALIRKASIDELCAHRNRAMDAYSEGVRLIQSANEAAKRAAPSRPYIGGAYVGVSGGFNRAARDDEFRKSIDRDCWRHLLEATGLGALMGAKQLREFEQLLQDNPPEFTAETAFATFAEKTANADKIFAESVVNAFEQAPRGFKSNDGFHLGDRMILEYAYSAIFHMWQHMSCGQDRRQIVRDLDRIMHILDRQPHETDCTDIVANAFKVHAEGGPGECETAYFRFRWFKKGTMHVWFLRPDLVREMNLIIAKHRPDILGRAA